MRDSERSALVLAAAAALGALLLIVAEFSTIASVDLQENSCATEIIDPAQRDRCDLNGFDRHGGAFLVLGLFALVMAWGAGIGGSRPAAAALVAIGLIVLGISLLADLPETNETGAIGRNFEGAEASKGAGLYLEILGGGLLVLAGVSRLRRT